MKTLSAHPSGKEASATTGLRRFTKVTASLLSSAALTACVLASRPCAAQPPLVTLRVEEPIYAGLPVWLDVEAADPCIAVRYRGSLVGHASGGQAEVIGPDGTTPLPAFRPNARFGTQFDRRLGSCPNSGPFSHGGTDRIPLHLVADLGKPGRYAVRWSVPVTDRLGEVPPTGWLTFDVKSATGAQRESWLTGLLAHQPSDVDALQENFIPALLAAFSDPEVTERLLQIMCAKDRPTSMSVSDVFQPALPDGAQLRLAHLIAGGCLTEGLVDYVNASIASAEPRFGLMPERERRRLMLAVLSALPAARGTALAHALNLAYILRGDRGDDLAKAADATVMQTVPRILAGVDPDASSTDQPKAMLLQYVSALNRVSGGKDVIDELAVFARSITSGLRTEDRSPSNRTNRVWLQIPAAFNRRTADRRPTVAAYAIGGQRPPDEEAHPARRHPRHRSTLPPSKWDPGCGSRVPR